MLPRRISSKSMHGTSTAGEIIGDTMGALPFLSLPLLISPLHPFAFIPGPSLPKLATTLPAVFARPLHLCRRRRLSQFFTAVAVPHLSSLPKNLSARSFAEPAGLMHEIYDCPPGHFENVYINYRTFGFRTTKWLVDGKQIPAEVRGGGKGVREKDFVR